MKAFFDQRMCVPLAEGSTPSHMKPAQLFQALHGTGLPIAWNLVGGYRVDLGGSIEPVLKGHINSFIACAKVYNDLHAINPWWS